MFFPTALLRDEAGLSHALIMEWTGGVLANWSCLPVLLRGHFFSRGFLSRHERWTKRKRDYSLSLMIKHLLLERYHVRNFGMYQLVFTDMYRTYLHS